MATIGQLKVGLVASVGRFVKNMDEAADSVEGIGSKAIRVGRKLLGFGAILTGVASAGGLVYMIKQAYETIDSLAKMADMIGISTKELAGLHHGANLTGASAEILNKALQVLSKNLAEATLGTGEARLALDVLGLTAEELIALPMVERLKMIADKLNAIQNPALRLQLAMKLFGEEGAKLVGLLSEGSAGIQAFIDEAERLGIAIDRVDAAQIEAANDAITRMKAATVGLTNQIAIQLAPYVKAAADEIVNFGNEGKSAGERVTAAMEMVTMSFAFVADAIRYVQIVWESLGYAGLWILKQVATAIGGILDMLAVIASATGIMEAEIMQAQIGISTYIKVLENDLTRIDEKLLALENTSYGDSVSEYFKRIRDEAKAAGEEIARAREETNKSGGLPEIDDADSKLKARELEQSAKRIFDATRTPLEEFKEEMQELEELFSKGLIDQDTLDRAIRMAQEKLDRQLGKNDANADPGRFQQVDLNRIAIQGAVRGGGNNNTVTAPQVDRTNEILVRILSSISGGIAVGA